jgi:hypothetical protein
MADRARLVTLPFISSILNLLRLLMAMLTSVRTRHGCGRYFTILMILRLLQSHLAFGASRETASSLDMNFVMVRLISVPSLRRSDQEPE